jgi:predicted nucleotidyltransferase
MLQIEDRHRQIIREILKKYPYKFYAFGSRTKAAAKKFSDLDICFMDNIPYNIRAHIEEDFENSNLPFIVELIDWNLCDDKFKAMIKKDLILL